MRKKVLLPVLSISALALFISACSFGLLTAITITGEGNREEVLIGETLQMVAKTEPQLAFNKDVSWSVKNTAGDSSREPRATITEKGILTGLSAGTVIVTATAKDRSAVQGTKKIRVTETEKYTLQIETIPSGGGNISFDTTTWFDSTTLPIEVGTTIEIYAQEAIGYTFEGWYEGDTKFCTNNHVSITMNENKQIQAKFSINKQYEELYNMNGGLYYIEDVSELFAAAADAGEESVLMKYYRLGENSVEGTTEIQNVRERLNLVDTNDDGIYDAWEVVEAADQEWIEFPAGAYETPYGTCVINEFVYSPDAIKFRSDIIEGPFTGFILTYILARVGLPLNVAHTRYIDAGAAGTDYGKLIELSERYDSDTTPEFSLLDETTPAAERTAAIKINVNAPNVADFLSEYDCRYMQASVSFPASLTLTSVDFGNFVDGSRELTNYKVLEYPEKKVIVLYRVIIAGADEGTTVTESFAELNFTTPEATGTGEIILTYDDDTYDEYGPMFRNSDNRILDGVLINYDSVEVAW